MEIRAEALRLLKPQKALQRLLNPEEERECREKTITSVAVTGALECEDAGRHEESRRDEARCGVEAHDLPPPLRVDEGQGAKARPPCRVCAHDWGSTSRQSMTLVLPGVQSSDRMQGVRRDAGVQSMDQPRVALH